jgi:hypothetical protein
MILVLFCGLERTPTFLVPIINPPFADISPHFSYKDYKVHKKGKLKLFSFAVKSKEKNVGSGARSGYNSIHRQKGNAP